MEDIIEALQNLFDFFETLFSFIMNIFKSIGLAFGYLIQLIPKVLQLIATLPQWLIPFGTITIGVVVAYFIIGRNAGKSD